MNYKWLVFSLLFFVVVFHIGVVFIVKNKNYELTSADYYAKELKYEENIQAMRRADAYSWQVSWQAGQLEVQVEAKQAPVPALQTVVLELTRPNASSEDQRLNLTYSAETNRWSAAAPLRSGAWNYVVSSQDERGSLQVPGRINVP
ncbi:MAG: FixH family protein [Acidobacteria bacterium]|nr:FixH family protein [Acidobacteriota bacterium]MCB9397463.1 FixH family protein [Acidobacteriota bacterium]